MLDDQNDTIKNLKQNLEAKVILLYFYYTIYIDTNYFLFLDKRKPKYTFRI